MQGTPTHAVFDVITDFLATEPSPEAIIAYHLPETLQQRLDDLLDRNGEDLLTHEEQNELQRFLDVDEMFAMLKSKMKRKLRNAGK